MPRAYQNSLFACCSPLDLCLKACCCPCVVSGRNHHRITHGTDQGYSTCNPMCVAWCGLASIGHFGWILQFLDRTNMRDKYDLDGSSCGACCTSWCCACCELIQTEKELDYIQVSQISDGYQKQSNMVAQPANGQYNP